MRLRKLALAVGLAGTFGAQLASALGLGEIKLESRLNEPLRAEIKLLQVRDLTKSEILVELASNDDFQRAGIDRVFFLTDLRFEIDLNSSAGPIIRVTSKKPVKEPYLNFLLESQWPNGRILREYTLLMDLPTFSDQKAAPVRSAKTGSNQAENSGSSASPSRSARDSGAAASSQSSSSQNTSSRINAPAHQGDVYGPVGSSDTLWEIALKVRPNRQYSVQQTMLAIQRLNPDSFINGNINLLRKGQVLRVPTGSDIDNVGAQQAVSEVAQQNSEWSGSGSAPQLDGSKRQRTEESRSNGGVSGRLTVAGADSSDSVQTGRAAGELGGDIASLQSELAVSQEELDSSRRENAELKDRVTEMEDQIETMERLLEVSNQELRALQQAAGESSAANDALKEDDEQSSETTLAEQSEAPQMAAEQEVSQPTDASKVVRPAKPKEPSFMDMALDNILYIGGAILAILVGIFLLLRRRNSEEEELDEGYTPSAPAAQPVKPEADIDAAIEAGVADDFDMSDEEIDLSEEDELLTTAPTESQTGDAVGEADIYIAYGKFDQAEEMLQTALEQDSSNVAARLKLMEVYLETQALDKFDEQYSEVVALGDHSAVARADDLRQQFADTPAYTEAADNEFALGNEELEFDLRDSGLSNPETDSEDFLSLDDDEPASVVESRASDSEFSIGEDFSLSFESELTSADRAAKSDELEDEFLLDLDDGSRLSGAETSLSDEDFELELEGATDDDSLELELSDAPDESEFLAELSETSEVGSSDDEVTLDLAGDEPDPLTLELPETDDGFTADELDLELDSSDDNDAFDLDMDDMDLAALDEEVNALSENMDFAGEEFGSEDAPTLDDELSFDSDDFDAGSLEFDGADAEELSLELDSASLGSASLDSTSLDSTSLDNTAEEAAGAEPESAPEKLVEAEQEESSEKSALDFDADEELNSEQDFDFDLELANIESESGSEEMELSLADTSAESLSDADETLSDEALLDEALSEDEVSELSLDDVPTLEEEAIETEAASTKSDDSEEFDLAADLGLDAEDFETEDTDTTEEDMFAEAMSELPTPEDVMDGDMSDEDFDAELDFLADTDEAATKLDLARAYIDMGDQEGAKDILGEVVVEGNDVQKKEAEELLTRIG